MPTLRLTMPFCDTCCDPCEVGDTIDAVSSGITLCPCGDFFFTFTNTSALNGASTMTNVVVGVGDVVLGTLDWHLWSLVNCAGVELETGTANYSLAITQCLDGVFTVQISAAFNTSSTSRQFLFFLGSGALDTPIANTLVCGDASVGADGGTITLSRP